MSVHAVSVSMEYRTLQTHGDRSVCASKLLTYQLTPQSRFPRYRGVSLFVKKERMKAREHAVVLFGTSQLLAANAIHFHIVTDVKVLKS